MRIPIRNLRLVFVLAGLAAAVQAAPLSDIWIRDPFILADPSARIYRMYTSLRVSGAPGVGVYTSRDLNDWSGPSTVFDGNTLAKPPKMIWAPEVHSFQGRYYLFATFTEEGGLPPVAGRPRQEKRGTWILVADSPDGPFQPLGSEAHTPPGWMALDGTLFVENGTPWMVFCHEWVQIENGTMELLRLKAGLSGPAGPPATLFPAAAAPWVRNLPRRPGSRGGYVTDGPFLHRTRSGNLVMVWSSFGDRGYAVGQALSASGKIAGPWKQHPERLFARDGGHAMIFRAFDGELWLVLHQPNGGGKERARLFELDDSGDLLRIRP